ncbi:phytanoyl-CoA dioxygenase family protein [Shewanella salipaludis]|uniref:Phytanoyl-CoA dioxygenase family protein n=1 Tax=Shewanella salipaludis TaxID=2723052 RepID=A0A972JIT6_9GAMM|nr:phytanoyl-CoA dioxygenase family protein [Shewanella salipaludis]NMH65423.1 phytanoyl-CoA dioxygenase family protein [Shewanella salipaludis]
MTDVTVTRKTAPSSHAAKLSTDAPMPAGYEDEGELGLYQLKRIFSKIQLSKAGRLDKSIREAEWSLDLMLYDELRLGLEPALQALYQCPSFTEFEHWVLAQNDGALAPESVSALNAKVSAFYAATVSVATAVHDPGILSASDWQHWQEQGFLVIPDVLDQTLCRRASQLVYDELGMDASRPETWYKPNHKLQKIMVQLFNHPVLNEIRHVPKIRAIFEALWQTNALWMSTDRVGFNPPERPDWQFPGPGMHWDLNFHQPVEFGTQALIYLTDTEAHQGAFSCVPGFHKKIDAWLASLPQGADPQDQDWQGWNVQPIAAKAGSLIIWHQALPHGSSPNRAKSPRIVQYLNMRPLSRR